MQNNFDYSWPIEKKISQKSKNFKVFLLIFFWGFLIFSSLVSADYYFFYKENKKFFSDQKAGFKLIGENFKNNFENKNFDALEKNFSDLEIKKFEFKEKILEKIGERKFLFGAKKIFFEFEKIFDDGIILGKNFLEIEKNFGMIFDKNFDGNPVENILKLNDENLKLLSKINSNDFGKFFLSKVFDEKYFKIIAPQGDLIDIFKEISENKIFISQIFGKNKPQTSVIFFQNSNESRATGGFVGSFLIFIANDGKILYWKVHDIYEFDGQLKGNFEKIPFEAKLLVGAENWSLRDFNVNPNLEMSSQNFNYFFEKSGGQTIDNFFYLDSKILTEILKITGPIKLKNLGISVDSNNWDFVFQYFVGSKKQLSKTGISSKSLMIGEFFLSLKGKIFDKEFFMNLLGGEKIFDLKNKIFEKGLIKFYSKNEKINDFFQKKYAKKPDEIQEIFISISGNKSGKFVEKKFLNWKENSSKKIISLKRNFFIDGEFEKFFEFLYQKFGSDIPKTELKKILGFGGNNEILQIYTSKKYDLLFVKFLKNGEVKKLNFKKWISGDKNVFEIDLPILNIGERDEVFLDFKKK
ncbi:DUF4012 domain-containing protein [Candidatus Gracilibacteria bacterium]|nr:DUF4012 domain-containing protein [Candidatus Gracilibacteria bacterium]